MTEHTDIEARAKELFLSGMTQRQIAAELGIPYPRIRKLSLNGNWKSQKHDVDQSARREVIAKIRERYIHEDISYNDLSGIYGISESFIKKIAGREKWSRQRDALRTKDLRAYYHLTDEHCNALDRFARGDIDLSELSRCMQTGTANARNIAAAGNWLTDHEKVIKGSIAVTPELEKAGERFIHNTATLKQLSSELNISIPRLRSISKQLGWCKERSERSALIREANRVDGKGYNHIPSDVLERIRHDFVTSSSSCAELARAYKVNNSSVLYAARAYDWRNARKAYRETVSRQLSNIANDLTAGNPPFDTDFACTEPDASPATITIPVGPEDNDPMERLFTDYIQGKGSLRDLAEQYSIPYATVLRHAYARDFSGARTEYVNRCREIATRESIIREVKFRLRTLDAADLSMDKLDAILDSVKDEVPTPKFMLDVINAQTAAYNLVRDASGKASPAEELRHKTEQERLELERKKLELEERKLKAAENAGEGKILQIVWADDVAEAAK